MYHTRYEQKKNELSNQSLWRNRLARSAVNREDGGSSPPRDVMMEVSIYSSQQIPRPVANECNHTWDLENLPTCGPYKHSLTELFY